MADETSMALDEPLRKTQLSDDVDFLREGMHMLAQALMEVDVTQHSAPAATSAPAGGWASATAHGMVPGAGRESAAERTTGT